MNILIVGAGSLGLLFAGKLAAQTDNLLNMTLVAHRKEQAQVLREQGITVEAGSGERYVQIPTVEFEPSGDSGDAFAKDWDWIMLMVKQTQLSDELIGALQRWAGKHARLLCFQNGIGHVERLSSVVPRDRLFLAVTTEGAIKRSDNVVAHTGQGETSLGQAFPNDAAFHEKELQVLTQLFNIAGFRAFVSNNIIVKVWNKLVINSAINPLTAILRIPNGRLLDHPQTIQLMKVLVDEAVSTANASGIPVSYEIWGQIVDVCRKTAANQSSMLQDIASGRRTEIEWINGAIVRSAEQCGVQTPTHLALVRLIESMQSLGGGA